ncbi:MAG: hypothetical protein QXV32_09440 [Conexivisphaerales archaeon]
MADRLDKKAVVKELAPIAVLALLGVAPIILDWVGGVVNLG